MRKRERKSITKAAAQSGAADEFFLLKMLFEEKHSPMNFFLHKNAS